MEITIQLDSVQNRVELFGPRDVNLRILRDSLDVQITAREGKVIVSGEKECVEKTAEIIDRMQKHLLKFGAMGEDDVNAMVVATVKAEDIKSGRAISVYGGKKIIEPYTEGQLRYIETMSKNDLTFCIGPAGTGKTYLAVAYAVSLLKRKQIRKIILARPAVEAGERLGFLPGDLQAKVNPYLRPLFDSLEDMMSFTQMRKFMEMDIIEVIPLAFMRGRTLNRAVIICDEAQNASSMQMLMVLTRLGRGSKMIITGDVTQVDLDPGQKSGIVDSMQTLEGVKGIGSVKLAKSDIVRHKLVHNIVQAYERKRDKQSHDDGQG